MPPARGTRARAVACGALAGTRAAARLAPLPWRCAARQAGSCGAEGVPQRALPRAAKPRTRGAAGLRGRAPRAAAGALRRFCSALFERACGNNQQIAHRMKAKVRAHTITFNRTRALPRTPLACVCVCAYGKQVTPHARATSPRAAHKHQGASCQESGRLFGPLAGEPAPARMVRATWHRVDFPQAHDSYNGVGFDVASDAALVCLSSVEKGAAGRIYALPRERPSGADAACGAAAPRMLADLSEVCGERTSEGIPQGKVHSLYGEGAARMPAAASPAGSGRHATLSTDDTLPALGTLVCSR